MSDKAILSTFNGHLSSASGVFDNPNKTLGDKSHRFMIHPKSSFRVGWDITSLFLLMCAMEWNGVE